MRLRQRTKDDGVTHDVTNQPPPLTGTNAWRGDPLLVQIAEDFSEPVRKELDMLGRFVLIAEAQELARLANTETPKLRTHDRQGRRIDLVEFHPAYHALMRRSVADGLHSSIWENGAAETGRRHQVRAARFYLTARTRMRASLPDHHDQRLARGADGQPEAVSRMGAARHHAANTTRPRSRRSTRPA